MVFQPVLHHFHGSPFRNNLLNIAGAGLPGMGFDLGLLLPNVTVKFRNALTREEKSATL